MIVYQRQSSTGLPDRFFKQEPNRPGVRFPFLSAVVLVLLMLRVAPAGAERGVTVTSPGPAKPYSQSYALVVGIDKYSHGWPRLNAAVSDARQMEAELKRQGFSVTTLLDGKATKREILKYLATVLPRQVKRDDRFLFYFAGHGQTESARRSQAKLGYIVPVDGARSQGLDQWETYLSMTELRRILVSKYAAKHVLLVFDSCFGGIVLTRSGGISQSVRSHLSKDGVMAITAGGEGELAADGLFTRILVSAMQGQADMNNDGFVTFGELALFSEQEVNKDNSNQLPRYGSLSGAGQMVFLSSLKVPDRIEPQDDAAPAGRIREEAPAVWPRQNPVADKDGDMEWIYIPAGSFRMGSEEGDSDETPVRPVEVAGFQLARTETTSAQYARCVDAGVCERPKLDSDLEHCNWGYRSREDRPMNCVTWRQAETFCEWVSGRLPYEVEWEYAAKGGTDRKYPWGEETASCSQAVMNDGGPGCGTFTTMPVCSREAGNTDQGVCDLAGSLWEWTLDLYRTKSSVPRQGRNRPVQPSSRAPRVLRGGSWQNGADALRCANRSSQPPDTKSEGVGFRCLKSSP